MGGDSRDRWEGDTLVDATNLNDQAAVQVSSALQVVERFTGVARGRILCRFTVDPTTWTKPWTASASNARRTFACANSLIRPGVQGVGLDVDGDQGWPTLTLDAKGLYLLRRRGKTSASAHHGNRLDSGGAGHSSPVVPQSEWFAAQS